ncbi:hypothetical protein Tco_0158315 [Tanacetum coccineum]
MYCRGKQNGVNILKSIDEGPFQMGTTRYTIAEGIEGAQQLGLERVRVYSDLSPEDKDRDNFASAAQSSTTPPSTYVQPHFADNTQLDSGLSPTNNLIKNLTNTLALLTQSYKTYLSQTINQLRTSSNKRNQATVQDGRVVVQNVQGRQNRGQGNNAKGTGAAGYGGAHNRVKNANPCQSRQIKCYNCNDPIYDEASPSYDSDILSEVPDHDYYQDVVCEHHEAHEMHDDVQLNYVVDSHTDYASDNNMITYDQYVKDYAMSVVQSNVSSVPNDAYMMIINEMHEHTA